MSTGKGNLPLRQLKSKTYQIIGAMSGTSLDGLDVAHCSFFYKNGKWNYKIRAAATYKYTSSWKKKLNDAMNLSGLGLSMLHVEFGDFIGKKIREFISLNTLKRIDFISSHGHTVFHQPDKKLTLQIGDGSAISAVTGLPVVFNFRTLDVALGGQGAPLVPIGDKVLFSECDFCLNLGGIANISFDKNNQRIAFDICPCNLPLNYLALKKNKAFDKNGVMAKKGKINIQLLELLNSLDFYKKPFPKSLGREWVEKKFLSIIDKSKISVEDKLHTVCEHIAFQISNQINSQSKIRNPKLLVTGGGAFNIFLIERIKSLTKINVAIPDKKTINFKEALVFAFLGLLRAREEINTLRSVTGASRDSCGGVIVGNIN